MRPELTVVSVICTILVLIPLPWHWRARNIPTLSLIFWLTAVNFPRIISTIIWAGNVNDSAPVWCDIVIWLHIGANWGFGTSAIPMCRYLAQVSSPYHRIENAREKRRRMVFEIFMCVVMPLIGMALFYVVQYHRYNIFEDFGCIPTFYLGILSVFLVNLPPVIFSLITLVYAAVALRWFIQRRTQFEAVLESTNSGLTTNRYLRLMLFLIAMMLGGMAMTTYVLIDNIVDIGVHPWISWDELHADWYSIDQASRDLTPQSFWDRWMFVWYLVPVTSVAFFAFFGCVTELKTEYMGYFNFVKTKVFRIKPKFQPVLPVSRQDGANAIESTTSIPVVVGSQSEVAVQALEK
ncbi:unnamed protein product [Rhizoctonia solani]|uniref:Pheromone B beta 1 receptor [Schizophyllum commune] n=1 Tax=Rhizoctonia solani TaxID=456999 RepID=A0A8H3C7M4_9AGAM|nr:unnamed protein product [Rhizoctonia solani]